jgi:hypothetical protein
MSDQEIDFKILSFELEIQKLKTAKAEKQLAEKS